MVVVVVVEVVVVVVLVVEVLVVLVLVVDVVVVVVVPPKLFTRPALEPIFWVGPFQIPPFMLLLLQGVGIRGPPYVVLVVMVLVVDVVLVEVVLVVVVELKYNLYCLFTAPPRI